jgi:hypothetical protein
MATSYMISYLGSDGDDYAIDGCADPHLTIEVRRERSGYVDRTIKVAYANIRVDHETDDRPLSIKVVDSADGRFSMTEVARILAFIADRFADQEGEFYSSVFYDDETEQHSKVLHCEM